MTTGIRKCIDKLYEDFVTARIGVALEVLGEDNDFKKVEAEYGVLVGRVYDAMGFEFGTDCESLLSKFFDFQTVAAYKQGFRDAYAFEGGLQHNVDNECDATGDYQNTLRAV